MASDSAIDYEEQLLPVSQENSGSKRQCYSRLYGFLCSLSLLVNVSLVVALYIAFNETADDSIPIPPADNTSGYSCPFPALDLSNKRKEPGLALTQIGTTFVGLCWRDFLPETRSESEGYQISMNDAWSGKRLDAYTGRSVTQNITNLLPDTNYTFTVSSIMNKKMSASVSVKTHQSGFCGNHADLVALKKNRDNIADISADCVLKNLLSDHKASECIKSKTGFSDNCIKCYLGEAHCSAKHCAAKCLHSRWAENCQLCNRKYCAQENSICTGLPYWAGPKIQHHPGR